MGIEFTVVVWCVYKSILDTLQKEDRHAVHELLSCLSSGMLAVPPGHLLGRWTPGGLGLGSRLWKMVGL